MFRTYQQLEHSDCGLTCVRMIARHYGKRVSARALRGMCDMSRLGVSVRDVIDCCSKIGLEATGVKIGMDAVDRLPLPAILYWDQMHFVVLYRVGKRSSRYHIADPSMGKAAYSESEFRKGWIPDGRDKGLVILVEPGDGFDSMPPDRSDPLRDFIRYVSRFISAYGAGFATVAVLSILLMAADFSIPLLLRRTVDEGIGLRDMGLVWTLVASQLAIASGRLVASLSTNVIMTRLGLDVNYEMVTDFLSRLVRFPVSFFDRKVSSDFIQKIDDQSRIKDFLITFPANLLTTLISLSVFSVLLWTYSPLIFLTFTSISLLEILWGYLFLSRRRALDYTLFSNQAENRNHAYEITNGMDELKVNNAENVRVEKWRRVQEILNRASMKSAWLGAAESGGRSVLASLKDLGITGMCAVMVIEGDITLGVMMTVGYITGRLSVPFNTISSSVSTVQKALLSYGRIEEVVGDGNDRAGDLQPSAASITMENIWFKYPGTGSPFVIKDVSFDIEEGKTTALVGESGCGKTTLIKLMLGFYMPQKGKLSLGGVPVEDLDNSGWLSHCGVVMQSGKIFTGSILENISLSEENPDVEKAWEMLGLVGLRDFVEKIPMSINTRLGVTGMELSGGQKQRLMIARAMYKNPEVLFLDEATSSLDANNERLIVENLRKFGKGKTIVVAAHRLSTVIDADRIIYIKDGSIEESGTHEELVALRGDYWRLVRNQLQLSV